MILSSKDDDLQEKVYQLSSDPEERDNVASQGGEELREIRQTVERFLDGGVARLGLEVNAGAISAETRRQLNALGYLTDEGRSPPRRAPRTH